MSSTGASYKHRPDIHVSRLGLPAGVVARQCAVVVEADSIARFGAWGVPLPQTLRRAVLKRQVEYLSGRFCSLSALRDAGYRGRTSLPANADRSAAWPGGWHGSISHCADVAVAIVANKTNFAGLGIDVENVMAGADLGAIADNVLLACERRLLRRLGMEQNQLITMGFSLKESLYKALWPQESASIEFHHARLLDICPTTQTFSMELAGGIHPRLPLDSQFQGAFLLGSRHVLSAIWVPGSGERCQGKIKTDRLAVATA